MSEQELRTQEDPFIHAGIKAKSAKWRVAEEYIGGDRAFIHSKI